MARILAMLPDDFESCRFARATKLRWYSLLVQASRCTFQSKPDLASAKSLFDTVESEAGRARLESVGRPPWWLIMSDDAATISVRKALRGAGLDV